MALVVLYLLNQATLMSPGQDQTNVYIYIYIYIYIKLRKLSINSNKTNAEKLKEGMKGLKQLHHNLKGLLGIIQIK